MNGEETLARTSRPGCPDDELGSWIADTVPRALAFAVSMVGNRVDAEDIVQDCYSRLLAHADRYDLPHDGTKLLFKAIANACINRATRRPPLVSLDAREPEAEPAEGPEPRAIHGELEAAVAEALAELPAVQRAIVELRSLGHDAVEIAEMLQISHANARVLLHRARQALAKRLGPFIEDHVT